MWKTFAFMIRVSQFPSIVWSISLICVLFLWYQIITLLRYGPWTRNETNNESQFEGGGWMVTANGKSSGMRFLSEMIAWSDSLGCFRFTGPHLNRPHMKAQPSHWSYQNGWYHGCSAVFGACEGATHQLAMISLPRSIALYSSATLLWWMRWIASAVACLGNAVAVPAHHLYIFMDIFFLFSLPSPATTKLSDRKCFISFPFATWLFLSAWSSS